jgi:hypothetical protein
MSVTLTTGIIARDLTTKYAHVDILNNSNIPLTVEITFLNWTNLNSSSVIKTSTTTLLPDTRRAYTIKLRGTSINHYEVQIKVLGDDVTDSDAVIANVFASTDKEWPPFTTVPANCITHSNLIRL